MRPSSAPGSSANVTTRRPAGRRARQPARRSHVRRGQGIGPVGVPRQPADQRGQPGARGRRRSAWSRSRARSTPSPRCASRTAAVVELDGKPEAEFDLLDEFIARHAIDLGVAEEAMAIATRRLRADDRRPRRPAGRGHPARRRDDARQDRRHARPPHARRDPPGDAEDARPQDAVDPGARDQPRRPPAPDRRRRGGRRRPRVPGARDDRAGAARRPVQRAGAADRQPGRAAGRADPVLGGGANRARAGHART